MDDPEAYGRAKLVQLRGSVRLHVRPVPMLVGPSKGGVPIGNAKKDGTLRRKKGAKPGEHLFGLIDRNVLQDIEGGDQIKGLARGQVVDPRIHWESS
jgi:hypothetical protein